MDEKSQIDTQYDHPPQVGVIAKLDDPDASAFFPTPVANEDLSVLRNGSLYHVIMIVSFEL